MSEVAMFKLNPSIEYVKIHGLQRSGTNYLAYLVDQNFDQTKALINAGGWKHGHYCAPWSLGQEVHVLTITKNPYSWLVSSYNYWKPDVSFDKYVKGRIVVEKQAGTPFLYLAANPVQHWNNMHYHWLSIRLNNKKSLVVPYELLVVMPQQVMEGVGIELGLKEKSGFANTLNIMSAGEENPLPSSNEWKDRNYYANNEYMHKFSEDLIKFVNDQLDREVMGVLGYTFNEGEK